LAFHVNPLFVTEKYKTISSNQASTEDNFYQQILHEVSNVG
jgi:hypothetical protein